MAELEYPTYKLKKSGGDIETILVNATEYFGMSEDSPALLKQISGGEQLVDVRGSHALFTSQIEVTENKGFAKINPLDKLPITVALANYATSDDIATIFSEQTSEQLPAPKINFSDDGSKISIAPSSDVYEYKYEINTTYLKNYESITETISSTTFDTELVLPMAPEGKTAFQTIMIWALGNDANTSDSEISTLTRVILGAPNISITLNPDDTKTCNISKPTDLSLINSYITDELSYTYTKLKYSYSENRSTIEDTKTISAESIEISLDQGDQITISISGSLKEDTQDIKLISSIPKVINNFKVLIPPELSFNSVDSIITGTHKDPVNDPVTSTRLFIYSIKTANAIDYSDEISIDTLSVKLSYGDTIRVKSIAPFYNDSDYTIYNYNWDASYFSNSENYSSGGSSGGIYSYYIALPTYLTEKEITVSLKEKSLYMGVQMAVSDATSSDSASIYSVILKSHGTTSTATGSSFKYLVVNSFEESIPAWWESYDLQIECDSNTYIYSTDYLQA